MTAMCRPNSFSNGEGSNFGSSIKCSSMPGAISSQAAVVMMLPGRAAGWPAQRVLEEIGRSCYIAGRQSDVCQSHGDRPLERLLGCELRPAVPHNIKQSHHVDSTPPHEAIAIMRGARRTFSAVLPAACLAVVLTPIAQSGEPQDGPSLEHEILPLLRLAVRSATGRSNPRVKLNVSSARSLVRGGESGPVVVPGKLDESLIWDQVATDDMPPRPGDPLSAAEKAILRRWIEQGAKGLPSADLVKQSPPWTDHWAFGPATHPSAPEVRNRARVRTAIDCFIQSALEDRGIDARAGRRSRHDHSPAELRPDGSSPEPRRDQRVRERLCCRAPTTGLSIACWPRRAMANDGASTGWMRRATRIRTGTSAPTAIGLWLIGIEITSFARSMPIVRSTRSCASNSPAMNWPVSEQGHYASSEVIDQLVATHFLRNGQDGTGESDGNPDEVRADKYAVLEGAIQIIGSSLLGLTLQCAKCHDHKFEPVTQKDYYQLKAILYPAFNVEHWVKPNDRVVIAGPRAEQARWEAHDKAIDAQIESLKRSFASGPNSAKKEKALKNR